jgi:hypothetical protein
MTKQKKIYAEAESLGLTYGTIEHENYVEIKVADQSCSMWWENTRWEVTMFGRMHFSRISETDKAAKAMLEAVLKRRIREIKKWQEKLRMWNEQRPRHVPYIELGAIR